jgi:hypothetical protein
MEYWSIGVLDFPTLQYSIPPSLQHFIAGAGVNASLARCAKASMVLSKENNEVFMNITIGNWIRMGSIAAVSLALSLAGLTGCATASYRSEAKTEQDQALAINVRDALMASTVYKYPGVRVTANRGRVELKGGVATSEQKHSAAEIAQQVPGVIWVDNDLKVEPMPPYPSVGATVPVIPPTARPPY